MITTTENNPRSEDFDGKTDFSSISWSEPRSSFADKGPLDRANFQWWSYNDERYGVVVESLSFANIVERVLVQRDAAGKASEERTVLEAIDVRGDARPIRHLEFEDPADIELFKKLDVGVTEFERYKESLKAMEVVAASLPEGLRAGFTASVSTKLAELLMEQRARMLDTTTDVEELRRLQYGQRDLCYALKGAAQALLVGTDEWSPVTDVFAWYESGQRGRRGGYNSTYHVCNDEFDYDDEDHAEQVAELWDNGDDALWPDEFHHPAKLEIRVDPGARIEFVYTPEIESAKQRHQSHSEITDTKGQTKVYDNQSLSIRIDLDPYAPHGIALDIGRHSHDATSAAGKYLRRSADLLGSIFGDISATGSHTYAGFTEDMGKSFSALAEQFAVQLRLQERQVAYQRISRNMGRAAASGL